MNVAVVAVALLLVTAISPARAEDKRVLGLIETVRIDPEGVLLDAKLDTGARTTSLDAQGISIVERDGKRWVSFEFHDGRKQVVRFERPLLRFSDLRTAPDVTEHRPVISMTICMDGISRETDVNLVDRGKLRYRMLIGRNFLIGAGVLVDSALKRTAAPACAGGGA